mmetsp:Transcript_40654/g.98894  ORF Transcript_40654/g.98894 Transcript_40654/m.98894 type:complete len:333 (-) Transcript_40654:991-1989(-)
MLKYPSSIAVHILPVLPSPHAKEAPPSHASGGVHCVNLSHVGHSTSPPYCKHDWSPHIPRLGWGGMPPPSHTAPAGHRLQVGDQAASTREVALPSAVVFFREEGSALGLGDVRYAPGMQEHSEGDSARLPAGISESSGHGVHTLIPSLSAYPPAHGTHLTIPESGATLPGTQGKHESPVLCVPAGHSRHMLSVKSNCDPGGQSEIPLGMLSHPAAPPGHTGSEAHLNPTRLFHFPTTTTDRGPPGVSCCQLVMANSRPTSDLSPLSSSLTTPDVAVNWAAFIASLTAVPPPGVPSLLTFEADIAASHTASYANEENASNSVQVSPITACGVP